MGLRRDNPYIVDIVHRTALADRLNMMKDKGLKPPVFFQFWSPRRISFLRHAYKVKA